MNHLLEKSVTERILAMATCFLTALTCLQAGRRVLLLPLAT
jgi:hypothetical protein